MQINLISNSKIFITISYVLQLSYSKSISEHKHFSREEMKLSTGQALVEPKVNCWMTFEEMKEKLKFVILFTF